MSRTSSQPVIRRSNLSRLIQRDGSEAALPANAALRCTVRVMTIGACIVSKSRPSSIACVNSPLLMRFRIAHVMFPLVSHDAFARQIQLCAETGSKSASSKRVECRIKTLMNLCMPESAFLPVLTPFFANHSTAWSLSRPSPEARRSWPY